MSPAESSAQDGDSQASADERDPGWGGREWADDGGRDGSQDADLERLRQERPPHHEERER